MLFRHGLNAKQTQVWLGHHSPAFTLATYVHILPDDLPDPIFFEDIAAVLDGFQSAQPTVSFAEGKEAPSCYLSG